MKLYIHTIFEPSAKKHLPFFSCFVKSFSEAIFRRLSLYSLVTLHNLHFLKSFFRRLVLCALLFAVCNMMYDAYAMRNDVMMLCYANDVCSEDTHKTHS